MGLKKKNEARLSKMQVTFLKTHTPIHNKEEIKKIYKKHLKECPDNKITKQVFQRDGTCQFPIEYHEQSK